MNSTRRNSMNVPFEKRMVESNYSGSYSSLNENMPLYSCERNSGEFASTDFKPNLIALSGYAGSGKDLFCSILIEELKKNKISSARIAFADHLKFILRDRIKDLYNIDIITATREQKEVVRHYLIECAEEIRKSSRGGFFPSHLDQVLSKESRSPKDFYIITDLRFDEYGESDELQWVKNKRGIVVNIEKFQDNNGDIIFCEAPNSKEKYNFPRIKSKSDYSVIWKHRDSAENLTQKVKDFIGYLIYSGRISTIK